MTTLNTVAKDQLCPLVTLLRDAPKPIPFEEFPALYEQLNWEKNRRRGGFTNYDINLPLAAVNEMRGELSRFNARVSDTIKERGAATQAAVRAAFPEVKQSITECIGFAPTGTPLYEEGADWDLDDGSVIRLAVGENVLEFMFMSKMIADLERYERRTGTDLDRPMDDIDA